MKKLFIYGLPRSGTWFLEKLICQNFNYDKRFNPQKHTLTPEKNNFNLVIYKNPYKWIESCIFRLEDKIDFFSIYSNPDRYNIEKLSEKPISNVLKKILTNRLQYFDRKGDIGFLIKTKKMNQQFIETIDPRTKEKIYINPYYASLFWKNHFNTFSQIENKLIIYYEDLLISKNCFELLDNIRMKFNILPRNKTWNIKVDNATWTENFNEEEMIPYYLETGNFKYLKSENLPLINLGLGNNWLEENTIYKTINHL